MDLQQKIFELKRYSLEKMAIHLKLTESEVVKMWESKEIDSFQAEIKNGNSDIYFYFDFVGVIVYSNFIIHVLPAYLEFGTPEEIERDYKLALRAIEQYKQQSKTREETFAESYSYLDRTKEHKYELMIELLRDYFHNGLYSTEEFLYVEDGFGEINWDITIETYYPLLVSNRPIYPTVLTESTDIDKSNIIQHIHRSFVGLTYKALRKSGLLHLLGLSGYQEHWQPLENIGSFSYLKRILQQERNIQFKTRKLYVLETLLSLLAEYEKSSKALETYEFGTRYFSNVWESACQVAFNNQLNEPLKNILESDDIKLNNELRGKTLKDITEKIVWEYTVDNKVKSFNKGGPIPDIISFKKEGNDIYMYILDAKYYNVNIGICGIKSVPGFNDVIKQYIYELAFRKFNAKNNINFSCNGFLFPALETNEGTTKVGFKPLTEFAKVPLQSVKAIEIPAYRVYMSYLEMKPFDWEGSLIVR